MVPRLHSAILFSHCIILQILRFFFSRTRPFRSHRSRTRVRIERKAEKRLSLLYAFLKLGRTSLHFRYSFEKNVLLLLYGISKAFFARRLFSQLVAGFGLS
jgi:hypothetical protein